MTPLLHKDSKSFIFAADIANFELSRRELILIICRSVQLPVISLYIYLYEVLTVEVVVEKDGFCFRF